MTSHHRFVSLPPLQVCAAKHLSTENYTELFSLCHGISFFLSTCPGTAKIQQEVVENRLAVRRMTKAQKATRVSQDSCIDNKN